ncbi:hypothetical protein GGTG_07254 [Gaeumannomyces tritici R3-111a-1]|uniref:Uncharacterized protein n=1 Tax=Gaeumannomyces tritici (strain R3-111a-1) TaxID=644352 RepID=J3P157_GAET3|nr:hypothetical protein GGTG_07254 [Gaeumannomyces tritici R3-111a-1]EJT77342.1 hypothetical protein GGTG_07254 [Gaeumannomyces tritici R3-111a-1]
MSKWRTAGGTASFRPGTDRQGAEKVESLRENARAGWELPLNSALFRALQRAAHARRTSRLHV